MDDEYISREAAKFCVKEHYDDAIIIALNKLPAADVAPVRHGRWINHGWSTVCSECGEDYAFAKRNYCPNCGARLDLEEDDGV